MKCLISGLFAIAATFSLISAAPAATITKVTTATTATTAPTTTSSTIALNLTFVDNEKLTFNPKVGTVTSTGLADALMARVEFDNTTHICSIQGEDPKGPFTLLQFDGVISPPQVVLQILCEDYILEGPATAIQKKNITPPPPPQENETISVILWTAHGPIPVEPILDKAFLIANNTIKSALSTEPITGWEFEDTFHNCFHMGFEPHASFLGDGRKGVITPAQVLQAIFCENLEF